MHLQLKVFELPGGLSTPNENSVVPQRKDLKTKHGLFSTDEWRWTVTLLDSKAKGTAAVTVCQQNLHCCSLLISITLSCLSSSPRSCRLRSEYSDGLSHSEQQAKPE